jgi:FlaA1/EpsC-like NDP-sugar epimerase
VPIVERHLAEGVRTNVAGTINVADAARSVGADAMVLISTDKAVQPTSLMGATKRAAEAYCEALDAQSIETGGAAAEKSTRFFSVRFGNVLGSSGSVVPLFKEQLEAGGPITVTHPDMERYFMTIAEAVSLVLMASAHGLSTGTRHSIYVLDMGKPVRIVDLAERMIRLAGLEPGTDVEIVFTGLRKGEKLHEELFDDGEALHRTNLTGILIAEPRTSDASVVLSRIRKLSSAASGHDGQQLLQLLAMTIPEYAGGGHLRPASGPSRVVTR